MHDRAGASAGADSEPVDHVSWRLIQARSIGMSTRGRLGTALMGLAFVLAGATPAAAGKAEDARTLLDQLNARWLGAEARMRVSIPIKNKIDGDGWSESPWMGHEPISKSDRRFYFKVQVSNRQALGHLIADELLLAGARFKAVGWAFEDPDRAKGLYLELRFADAPSLMRLRFNTRGFTMKAQIEAKVLVHIERYVRIDAFELSAAEERLAAVVPTVAPTRVPRPPTPTPAPMVFLPRIGLVTAEVRPRQVRPGGEVRLVVSYELSGLRPGEIREVTEIRRIASGTGELKMFEHRVQRRAGTVISELPVRVPPDAAPGVYSVSATLRLAGVTAVSDTAVLQVTRTGGVP